MMCHLGSGIELEKGREGGGSVENEWNDEVITEDSWFPIPPPIKNLSPKTTYSPGLVTLSQFTSSTVAQSRAGVHARISEAF